MLAIAPHHFLQICKCNMLSSVFGWPISHPIIYCLVREGRTGGRHVRDFTNNITVTVPE